MRKQIFYGAGENAKRNIKKWLGEGYQPLCFVDRDEKKWNTSFGAELLSGEGIPVLSFEEAMTRYPDEDIYITLERKNLKEVTEYLLGKGIAREKIKYFEAVEYRMGCNSLGVNYCEFDGLVRTCCVPNYLHVGTPQKDRMKEKYESYNEYFLGRILTSWKADNPDVCKGCKNLRYDIYDIVPQIRVVTIGSIDGEDYCNARCIYCANYPKPSYEAMEKRKRDVVEMLEFFSERTKEEELFIDVSGGEIAVAPFRRELFEILIANKWGACIRTNASIYCEEISELLEQGKSYLHVTLDSTEPELYAKCKGINALPKVMDNLRKYSKHGKIVLKWIVLDGIYNDFEQVKGIVDFAKEINATLALSCDTFRVEEQLSQEAFQVVIQFIRYAKEKKVSLNCFWDHFHEEDSKRLKATAGI